VLLDETVEVDSADTETFYKKQVLWRGCMDGLGRKKGEKRVEERDEESRREGEQGGRLKHLMAVSHAPPCSQDDVSPVSGEYMQFEKKIQYVYNIMKVLEDNKKTSDAQEPRCASLTLALM
jgi:hypothetical protein